MKKRSYLGVNTISRSRLYKKRWGIQLLKKSIAFHTGYDTLYLFAPFTFWNLRSINDWLGFVTVHTEP
jgi:hypothetical protein